MFKHKGKEYNSKKFPILEDIFNRYYNEQKSQSNIEFTLKDISTAYSNCGIKEPASISNTILDLTRKKNTIQQRLPQSIINLGYDLRKKTGKNGRGDRLAGEFVYVGLGNEIDSWLIFPDQPDDTIEIDNIVPPIIQKKDLLSNDEAAMFSVIDYCDVLTKVIYPDRQNVVIRVQNPKKWQPNEIDGLYIDSQTQELYPCEAKALSTKDDINLEQMWGGYKTVLGKIPGKNVTPLALVMKNYGLDIGFLSPNQSNDGLVLKKYIKVEIKPEILSWK